MRKFEEAQQVEAEFNWLLDIFKKNDVRSYLEVGSRTGGSLWRVAKFLPTPSTLVSIDMPNGTEHYLRECVAEAEKIGHKVSLFIGDSTDQRIIERASALSPFDAVFIDANHTEPYVRKDWANYGPMASKIVAFHDINWKGPRPGKLPINVPEIWEEIKKDLKTDEIRLEPRDNGIGVIFK